MGLLLNGETYRFVDVVGGCAKLSPDEYFRWVEGAEMLKVDGWMQ